MESQYFPRICENSNHNSDEGWQIPLHMKNEAPLNSPNEMIWHWNHQVQGTPGHRKISVGISFPMTISNFLSFSTRILTHKSICSEQWWSPDKTRLVSILLQYPSMPLNLIFFYLARFRLYFLNSNLQNYGSLQHKGFQSRKIFFISAFWFEFFFWNSTKWNNVACFLSGSTVFFFLSI